MLEAMAGAAADQHHIGHFRMAIDQEVAVRAVFILADLRPGQRCALEERKATVAEGDDLIQRGASGFARLGVGIDLHPVLVMGELDPAAFEIGEAVIHVAFVEIGPAGHGFGEKAAIALGRREVEDFLPGGEDAVAKQVGKEFLQPGTKREYKGIGLQRRAAGEANGFQRPALVGDLDHARPVVAAGCDEALDQGLHRAPCHQRAKARLEQAGMDPGEIDHRKAPPHFGRRHRFGWQAESTMRRQAVASNSLLRLGRRTDAVRNEDRQA